MNTTTFPSTISGLLPTVVVSLIDQGAPAFTYCSSNYLFRSFVHLGAHVGNTLGQLPEHILNTSAEYATGTNPHFNAYNTVVKPILVQYNPLDRINAAATKIIAPQVYEFAQENLSEDVCTFQAADLIGPAIVQIFSSKKCSENIFSAYSKIKLLISSKRRLITQYNLPTGCQTGTCTSSFYFQENFSTPKLLLGTTLDITFATAWFSLSQYTAQGILNAVSQANPQLSPNIIAAMRVGSTALPIVWSFAKYLKTRPSSTEPEPTVIAPSATPTSCAAVTTLPNPPPPLTYATSTPDKETRSDEEGDVNSSSISSPMEDAGRNSATRTSTSRIGSNSNEEGDINSSSVRSPIEDAGRNSATGISASRIGSNSDEEGDVSSSSVSSPIEDAESDSATGISASRIGSNSDEEGDVNSSSVSSPIEDAESDSATGISASRTGSNSDEEGDVNSSSVSPSMEDSESSHERRRQQT